MGKPNYSYEKRQLQLKKQKKRQEKLERKKNKKPESPDDFGTPDELMNEDPENRESTTSTVNLTSSI